MFMGILIKPDPGSRYWMLMLLIMTPILLIIIGILIMSSCSPTLCNPLLHDSRYKGQAPDLLGKQDSVYEGERRSVSSRIRREPV